MKKEFRKQVISTRKQQSVEDINSKSKNILDNLLSIPEIEKAKTILAYLDFNAEVKTDDIINTFLSVGKRVLTPISIVQTKQLLLSELYDIEKEVEIATYGIREPKEAYIRPVDSKEVDVVLVPAVAFDTNGYRLGYGGGFYDRFIETLRPDCITIGIAFELQIFDDVPKEEHDAKMNYIVTENRILRTK